MLRHRWINLCERIGLAGDRQWLALEAAYASAGRAYHNLGHIEQCLAEFDGATALAEDPVAVELAIWFHDLVYDTRRSDNEERSADAAAAFLHGTPYATDVAQLILTTKHQGPVEDCDARLVGDIDLSILGSDVETYDCYARAIRREYAWVLPRDFATGRIRVLGDFLARPELYSLPHFRQRLQAQARANIRSEIERLERRVEP